ncbi:hypothetical protein ONZ45_g3770 [Pleurotus djamor]|nr:hypothetical protein ONZ45_g3770 [Pleurotus djamor]
MPHTARNNTLELFGDPTGIEERKGYMELATRRRLRRLRLVKRLLEFMVVVWTTYNIIRYFIAYTVFTSFRGQVAALSLGAVASVSLAVFLSSEVLSLLKAYLMFHDVSLQFQFIMRTSLHALSHLLLLVPAIVNFALVIAWKDLATPDIAYLERCNMDIDVVWSVSKSKCSPWTWETWVSFALVRIFLTLALIVLHFYSSFAYQKTRRPGHLPRPLLMRRAHGRGQSATELLSDSTTAIGTPIRQHTHQASYATLASSSRHHASSSSLRRPSSEFSSSVELDHTDPAMDSFYDRYNAAINQIHRETEEGMRYAEPDTPTGLPPGAAPPRPSENYLATMAMYDEYGRPRPPEGHVRMLGAYVKRMPTIESIGSREAGSFSERRGSLSPRNSLSRPPTRANTFSTISVSEPPSRSNSLSVAAERLASGSPASPAGSGSGVGVLAGVSEVGEIVGPRVGSAGTFGSGADTQPSLGTSYYTAASLTDSARTTPE